MNTDFVTLSSLTQYCIDNDVDFEVWHGVTTHKDKRVRAHLLVSPANSPEAVVTFGDRKFGQRVSYATLAKNNKISVDVNDLILAIRRNSAVNQWKRSIQKDTPLFNLKSSHGNVQVSGTNTTADSETFENRGYATSFHSYELLVRNFLMDSSTEQVSEVAQTRFKLEIPETDPQPFISQEGTRYSAEAAEASTDLLTLFPRDMGAIPLNAKLDVEGKFRYPNIIEVSSISF